MSKASLWLVLCLGVFLTSCSSSSEEEDKMLEVSPTSLTLDDDGVGKVNVTSNTSWFVYTNSIWLNASPGSGEGNGQVTFTAESASEDRTVKVVIKSDYFHRSIEVTQLKKRALAVMPKELTFAAEGGTQTVSVTSSEQWTTESTWPSWCVATPASGNKNGTLSITCTPNTSTTERYSGVSVKESSGNMVVVLVTQQAAPYVGPAKGTLDNPYTASEAHQLAASLQANKTTTEYCYVKGYISEIREVSTSYGNATYYLADTRSGSNALYVYRGLYLENTRFTSEDQIKKGDEVVLYTRLTNYRGTTPETVESECYIYMLNGETKPETSSESQLSIDVNGVSFKMIRVDGGTFQMGSTQNNYLFIDELPAHSVTLSSYYIGETEVTQELWKAVMGSNPSHFNMGSTKLPVERIDRDDCLEFIAKLNTLTGRKFRLPTEAEWEFAARGGNKSKGYKYAGSNTLGNVAWYTDNSNTQTHVVATKQANELGLYDMSGNVQEWCHDWYGNYNSNSVTNPTGPSNGSKIICRGGGFMDDDGQCRVVDRFWTYMTGDKNFELGLRLAL